MAVDEAEGVGTYWVVHIANMSFLFDDDEGRRVCKDWEETAAMHITEGAEDPDASWEDRQGEILVWSARKISATDIYGVPVLMNAAQISWVKQSTYESRRVSDEWQYQLASENKRTSYSIPAKQAVWADIRKDVIRCRRATSGKSGFMGTALRDIDDVLSIVDGETASEYADAMTREEDA